MPPKRGKKPQLDEDFEAQLADDFIVNNTKTKKAKPALSFGPCDDNGVDDIFAAPIVKKDTPVEINRANLFSISNFDNNNKTNNTDNNDDDDDVFAFVPQTKRGKAAEPAVIAPPVAEQKPQETATTTATASDLTEEELLRQRRQRLLAARRQEMVKEGITSSSTQQQTSTTSIATTDKNTSTVTNNNNNSNNNNALIASKGNVLEQQQVKAQLQQQQALNNRYAMPVEDLNKEDEEEDEFTFVSKTKRSVLDAVVEEQLQSTGVDAEEQIMAQLKAMSEVANIAVNKQAEEASKIVDQRTADLPDDTDNLEDLFIEVTMWREREARRLIEELEDKMAALGLDHKTIQEAGGVINFDGATGDEDSDYYVMGDDDDDDGKPVDDKTAVMKRHGLTAEEYAKKKEERQKYKSIDNATRIQRRKRDPNDPKYQISEHEYYSKNKTLYDAQRNQQGSRKGNEKVESYTTDDFARNKHKYNEKYSAHNALFQPKE